MGGRGRAFALVAMRTRDGKPILGSGRIVQLTKDGQWQLSPAEVERIMNSPRGSDAMKQAFLQQMSLSQGSAAQTVKAALAKSGITLSNAEAGSLSSALLLTGSLLGGGSLRTRLYRAGRLLGDYSAVKGGSASMVKRLMRRLTGRVSGKVFKKVFPKN